MIRTRYARRYAIGRRIQRHLRIRRLHSETQGRCARRYSKSRRLRRCRRRRFRYGWRNRFCNRRRRPVEHRHFDLCRGGVRILGRDRKQVLVRLVLCNFIRYEKHGRSDVHAAKKRRVRCAAASRPRIGVDRTRRSARRRAVQCKVFRTFVDRIRVRAHDAQGALVQHRHRHLCCRIFRIVCRDGQKVLVGRRLVHLVGHGERGRRTVRATDQQVRIRRTAPGLPRIIQIFLSRSIPRMALDRTHLQLLQKHRHRTLQTRSRPKSRIPTRKTGEILPLCTRRLRKRWPGNDPLVFNFPEGIRRRRLLPRKTPFLTSPETPERTAFLSQCLKCFLPLLDKTPCDRHRRRLVHAHRHSRQAIHVFRAFSRHRSREQRRTLVRTAQKMETVARERFPLVANTFFRYHCRRTRKQNGFPCTSNKTRWTRQGKRFTRNTPALHGKSAFLYHLTVRRR